MTRTTRVISIGALAMAVAGATIMRTQAQQTQPPPMPGVKLSIDKLESLANHVRAGRKLLPKAWPNNAKAAVALSFDVDNESAALARGNLGSEILTQGEYGAVDALPRILALLDKHNIPASFYIPAVSAILHPRMVNDILSKQRHEIGVHGWIHELLPALNDEAEEQRLLTQSIDYLTKATGKKPVGYRAPSWAFSQYTMKQVQDAGFLYDSSLMSSDDPYEILLDGKPTGVVELPIERINDDFPYFGAASGSLPSPDLVFGIFRAEFDKAYEEGGLYVLTMHPHISGHRSRIAALDAFIRYVKSRPGVWFATEEQIARYVRGAGAGTP